MHTVHSLNEQSFLISYVNWKYVLIPPSQNLIHPENPSIPKNSGKFQYSLKVHGKRNDWLWSTRLITRFCFVKWWVCSRVEGERSRGSHSCALSPFLPVPDWEGPSLRTPVFQNFSFSFPQLEKVPGALDNWNASVKIPALISVFIDHVKKLWHNTWKAATIALWPQEAWG